jgi:hypothetical protein
VELGGVDVQLKGYCNGSCVGLVCIDVDAQMKGGDLCEEEELAYRPQ